MLERAGMEEGLLELLAHALPCLQLAASRRRTVLQPSSLPSWHDRPPTQRSVNEQTTSSIQCVQCLHVQ